eukprot:gene12489-14659_t
MFTKSHKRTASGMKRLDITFNVEEMTSQERESRMLHTSSRKNKHDNDKQRLFEWFLVIGVEQEPIKQQTHLAPKEDSTGRPVSPVPARSSSPGPVRSAPSFFSKPPLPHSPKVAPQPTPNQKPRVLYQYPPDKPLGSIDPTEFPFPNGVPITTQTQTASHSNLFQLLYTQRHLKDMEDSFVFMLTDEKKDPLYGVCTMKMSPVESVSSDIDIDVLPDDAAYRDIGSTIKTAPRCFVVLSKYPFFQLHFNILNGALSLLHVQHIDRFQNLMFMRKRAPSPPPTIPTTTVAIGSSHPTPAIQITTPPTSPPPTTSSTSSNALSNSSNDNNNNNNNTLSISNSSNLSSSIDAEIPEQVHPIRNLIEYFYNESIPMPGKTMTYSAPTLDSKISFRRATPKPGVTDLTADYSDFMMEYGLFLTLQLLTHKTIIATLNALLLEKRVVFLSKSLRCLTSVFFAITSLLKPFASQFVTLPILPSSLSVVLESYMPFVIGLHTIPTDVDFSEIVIVDIDQNKVVLSEALISDMPPFPRWKDLGNRMMEESRELRRTLPSKELSYAATDQQEKILDRFVEHVEKHLNSLFENFLRHCVRDVTQAKHVSVFVPESFLAIEYQDEEENQLWISKFMKTQMFAQYLDVRLRTGDGDLSRSSDTDVKPPVSS